jgi:hypothetical protein
MRHCHHMQRLCTDTAGCICVMTFACKCCRQRRSVSHERPGGQNSSLHTSCHRQSPARVMCRCVYYCLHVDRTWFCGWHILWCSVSKSFPNLACVPERALQSCTEGCSSRRHGILHGAQAAVRAAATMSAFQAAAEFQERSAHSNGPGSSCGHRRSGPSNAATAGHLQVDHSAISTQAAEPEVVDLCDSDDDEIADAPLQPTGLPAQLPSGLQQHGTLQSSRQQQRHSQRQVVQRQQQQRDGAAGGRGQGWQLGFAPSHPQANGAARSSAAATSTAAGSGSGSNPFLSPARYIPEAGRL